jgi:hypothetical protein
VDAFHLGNVSFGLQDLGFVEDQVPGWGYSQNKWPKEDIEF